MDIGSVAEVVTTCATTAGIILILRQFRLQLLQSKYQALNDLHSQVLSQTMREGLQGIYKMEKDAEFLSKDKYQRDSMELVLDTYDLVGFRVREKVLPEEATLETEFSVILRIWDHAEKFVRQERLRRKKLNYPDYYKKNLEWLATKAKYYMEDKKAISKILKKYYLRKDLRYRFRGIIIAYRICREFAQKDRERRKIQIKNPIK
jgi:hypothetical protein